jgi:hypothetical protein
MILGLVCCNNLRSILFVFKIGQTNKRDLRFVGL